jgi:hypothetical protein
MKPSTIITIVLSLFFLSAAFSINAQINKRDIVYLKNGSIIKGYILEMVPNGTIKVKTSDGSIFIYKMEEVEKTAKEGADVVVNAAPEQKQSQASPDGKSTQDMEVNSKGYLLMVRGGPNLHVAEIDPSIDASFGIINAVQINEYLSLGIGVEATTYMYDGSGTHSALIFPVFLDTRLYVPRQKIQPMFGFQFGYSFINNKNSKSDLYGGSSSDFVPQDGSGGTYLAVNAGMRILINNVTSIIAEGGLSFQQLKNSYNQSNSYNAIETIPSLKINLGLCINLSAIKNRKGTSK